MAKVINLSKFKKFQPVELDGAEYVVRTSTIQELIAEEEGADEAQLSEKEKFLKLVERVSLLSNIPVEILKQQPMEVLMALLRLSQGLPVEEPQDEEEAKKKS